MNYETILVDVNYPDRRVTSRWNATWLFDVAKAVFLSYSWFWKGVALGSPEGARSATGGEPSATVDVKCWSHLGRRGDRLS